MAHSFIFKAFAFLLTFIPFCLVSGLSIRTASDINGYTIGTMGFKGTIHGVEFESYGTVEQMYAEFTKLHPEVVANAIATQNNTSDLEARGADYNPRGDYYCCPINGQPEWDGALATRIYDGINYLNNFNGVCNTGGGPGNCVRVSCSYNSAIFLCNDNPGDLVISCKDVASYAQTLTTYNHCEYIIIPPFGPGGVNYVCGQIFDTGNYNVIVREDGC